MDDGATEIMDVGGEPEAAEDAAGAGKGVSRMVLVVSVFIAAALAGLAGVVIGWKLEQQRVKDDIANIRPVGTVTAVEDGSVTIELITAGGSRTFVITDETVVGSAETADVSDIAEGATVLVKNRTNSDGDLQATEIIVLPDSTTYGKG